MTNKERINLLKEGLSQKKIEKLLVESVLKRVKTIHKGDKGEPGEKGDKPVYQVDYLTHDEIEALKKEITPIKGKDYFDGGKGDKGDDGIAPTRQEIIQSLLADELFLLYTKAKNPPTAEQVANELENNETFLRSIKGEKGDAPEHEWKGSKLRFKKPDGTWGKWVELKSFSAVIQQNGGGGGSSDSTSSGASDFLGLSDTPNTYTGQGGKVVAIKVDESGLEFATIAGTGDMTKAVYDPQNKNDDAFDTDNHTDGVTNKVYTATEKTKLAGIATGAEVNVNADWNSVAGDSLILNKPTLATVATTGAYADLSGKPTIPDELADLTADATHRTVTDVEKGTWNGKQDALTFGIADTNKVQINSADVADNDYAKFTATGLEGRSYAEVLSDIGAEPAKGADDNYVTDAEKIVIGNTSGTNTGDSATPAETATTIGALIGGAGDATPNDTDFVATSLTAGGILKKITWTNVKAFLKTYFDTLYQATGSYLTSANIDDTAYGVGWNGDTTHAPSKNAVYDKIETLSAPDLSGLVPYTGATGNVDLGTYALYSNTIRTLDSATPDSMSIFSGNATSGNNTGGDFTAYSGNGDGSGNGGAFYFNSGTGGDTGNAGAIDLTAGNGGATSGNGGTITLLAGNAQASGNGGNIKLQAGVKGGAGTDGVVEITDPNSAANAILDTATLTGDQTFTFPDQSGTLALTSDIGGGSTVVTMSGSQVINSGAANLLTDITDLSFAMLNGKTYHFRFIGLYIAGASTCGSRWSVNCTSPTYLTYKSVYQLTVTTVTTNAILTAVKLPSASNATSNVSNGGANYVEIEGIVRASQDDTFQIQGAREVTASTITLVQGILIYEQLD